MNVLGICGSLQASSSNLTFLHDARELAPAGMSLEIFDGVRDLPLFNPDLEGGPVPVAVAQWREALATCDAVLIATPEYGHSLPGALKNAIDWIIGSGELHRKVVGVTASAPGPGRGQRGLDALCATLRAVDARIVGGEPIVRDADQREAIEALLEAMADAKRG